MGWQWHQLDHNQIICIFLYTDNHANMPIFSISNAGLVLTQVVLEKLLDGCLCMS